MARQADIALRMRGVTKRFGPITAVDGLDLDVPAGTCVGLLGPNGAGKSTTMKMLTAQAIADEGELEVLGFRLPGESKQARAECGVVPQLDNLDTTLTVEQNLRVFAWLYRLGGWLARRVLPLLPRAIAYGRWNAWGRQRELPPMPRQTFRQLYRRHHRE